MPFSSSTPSGTVYLVWLNVRQGTVLCLLGKTENRPLSHLFASAKIGTGGYFVTFCDSIDIPAALLYENGKKAGISGKELSIFLKHNLLETSEVCELLKCSRQNLSYLIKQGLLTPVKEGKRGNLFWKGDVLRNLW